jgi:hypothetical protein
MPFIDGEIISADAKGHPNFSALQRPQAWRHDRMVFYAFDLLHLDGFDTSCGRKVAWLWQHSEKALLLIGDNGRIPSGAMKAAT